MATKKPPAFRWRLKQLQLDAEQLSKQEELAVAMSEPTQKLVPFVSPFSLGVSALSVTDLPVTYTGHNRLSRALAALDVK